ncbi:hypothetical protein D9756_006374 [Leucocoprinus leucothites]|uniref:GAG-pre-integrase domain-containing protein n=1 Tax=Leucocoprinus leucothites TaxID=201217 RepID=A0A8H5G241_9AGAR|nr:hypothetical protein D9756_006374 [Leucoagaricus leucothites]
MVMSSINNGASRIPVLQGPQNYQFWSMRMQGYLSMITTPGTPFTGWTVTTGLVSPLPAVVAPAIDESGNVTNAEEAAASLAIRQEEERRRNFLEQSAIGLLIQAVPDSMLHLIVQGDPNATWEALQRLYGVQGPASVYGDFVRAVSWSLPGNMDPAQSIAELESLFTRIEGATTRLPEVIRAMILLRAVPQGMETLAQSILANQTQMSQLTWDLVRSAIQAAWSQKMTASASRAGRSNGQWQQNRNPGNQQRQGQGQQPQGPFRSQPQQQQQQQQPPNQGAGQKPGNPQTGNPGGDGKKGKRGKRGGKKGKGAANEAATDADATNTSGVSNVAPQYGASSAIGFAAPAIANRPLLANRIASLAEPVNAGPSSSTRHLVAEARKNTPRLQERISESPQSEGYRRRSSKATKDKVLKIWDERLADLAVEAETTGSIIEEIPYYGGDMDECPPSPRMTPPADPMLESDSEGEDSDGWTSGLWTTQVFSSISDWINTDTVMPQHDREGACRLARACSHGMHDRLMSAGQLLESGLRSEADKHGTIFRDESGNAVLSAAPRSESQPTLQTVRCRIIHSNASSHVAQHPDYNIWHQRLGHPSNRVLSKTTDSTLNGPQVSIPDHSRPCPGCMKGKMHQKPFNDNPIRAKEAFEHVHSDLFELPIVPYHKYKWVMTLLDDYSSFAHVPPRAEIPPISTTPNVPNIDHPPAPRGGEPPRAPSPRAPPRPKTPSPPRSPSPPLSYADPEDRDPKEEEEEVELPPSPGPSRKEPGPRKRARSPTPPEVLPPRPSVQDDLDALERLDRWVTERENRRPRRNVQPPNRPGNVYGDRSDPLDVIRRYRELNPNLPRNRAQYRPIPGAISDEEARNRLRNWNIPHPDSSIDTKPS